MAPLYPCQHCRSDGAVSGCTTALLLDYAKKNGIIISKDFIFEESVSGRHADKRPKFQEMIGIAKQESHPIDVILVWKYSRFARNQKIDRL